MCIDAADLLAVEGIFARVVSMPSWELFDEADAAYRASVLPAAIPTLAVEAGVVVRLGALVRRQRDLRPLRRVGRRATWCSPIWATPPRTSPSERAALLGQPTRTRRLIQKRSR